MLKQKLQVKFTYSKEFRPFEGGDFGKLISSDVIFDLMSSFLELNLLAVHIVQVD